MIYTYLRHSGHLATYESAHYIVNFGLTLNDRIGSPCNYILLLYKKKMYHIYYIYNKILIAIIAIFK